MMKKVCLVLGCVLALDARSSTAAVLPEDKVDRSIQRAVRFLTTQQDREGAIQVPRARGNRTAMTALALLSMGATGHQPADDTPEGQCMKRALSFLLRPGNQEVDGYFGKADGSRMYGHGIVTLALAEFIGMGADLEQDRLIVNRCKAAIDLILRAQAIPKSGPHGGGWRYAPDAPDSDLSVTVWQVSALRAAKNAGLEVPKAAIDRAIGYIKRCYHSPKDAVGRPLRHDSACAYGDGKAPIFSTAAAGLLSLQVCGNYDGVEVVASADWLTKTRPDPDGPWFYYGTYYYAQGMYQRGGLYEQAARKNVEETLLSIQQEDGSWISRKQQRNEEAAAGPVYSTSLAILALAVKHHFLPIYQR